MILSNIFSILQFRVQQFLMFLIEMLYEEGNMKQHCRKAIGKALKSSAIKCSQILEIID